jgi:hypothetical protein
LPGSNSVRQFIRFEHSPSYSSRWWFDERKGRKRWLCVLYWLFLWIPQWRRVEVMCEIFQMGAHTVCWSGGRFYLWALLVIIIVLFLVCILCICNFLKFCNYSLCFLCKLSTSPN